MKTACTSFLVLALVAAAGRGDSPKEEATKDKGADKEPNKKFTIGKETTYVTGPLDKEGYVDYAAALNKRLSKGATPANNACVLIWEALGPRPEGGRNMPPKFFKWLGIAEPPEKGDYFIDLSRYLREQLKVAPGKDADAILHQLDRSMQRPWTTKEYPALASWLKANDKPLVLVVQATRRSHYFSPLTPPRAKQGPSPLTASLLPAVQQCRALASALAARALLRVGQGDADGAWQDLLTCHRLGRLVGRGATVVEALAGMAIDSNACRADLAFLDRTKPGAKHLQNYLGELHKLPPLPDVADKMDLGERFLLLDMILMADRYGLDFLKNEGMPPKEIKPIQDVDWDPALRNVNRCYDRMVSAMRGKDRAVRAKQLKQIVAEQAKLRDQATGTGTRIRLFLGGKQSAKLRGESIGHMFIWMMLPALLKVDQAAERTRQTADNVITAFALEWYRRDHGRYPKSLAALAPKYLATVPQDRFSGKPLIYRSSEKGYLLYSVGVDGRDDGGRTAGDDPPGDDLPVRMPLLELPRP
jgi:hypothetical protein